MYLNQQAGQQPLVHTYGVNHPPPGGNNVVVNATFAPTAAGSTQITHYFLRTRQTGFGATGNAANGWRASDQGNGWSGFHLIFYSQTGNVAAPPSTLLGTYTITVTGTGKNSGQTVRISGQVITTPNNNQQQNQNQTGSQQSFIPLQQTFQQQWAILLQQQQLGRISGRGTTMILKRRFNPKSGKVELTKNGVISRLGYLNLKGKNLNRRQALRNYRYR